MQHGEVVAGRFLVDRLAGRGGMGEVYRAIDQSTGLPVAIKVLLNGDLGDASRFEREARMLSSLEHAGVVRHITHGSLEAGLPYLVMEWLEGIDLAARLQQGPLDVATAISLMTSVAETLGILHARRMVHRDLKPSNIFLPHAGFDNPKLLDFGIASSETLSRITQTGMVLGTASYMAPEQASGSRVSDARADVFSLGCVLYECLAGQKAFDGVHLVAILTKILFGEPPALRELRPGLPEALYDLVTQLLAKSPEDRPADGHFVAQALRNIEAPSTLPFAETARVFRRPVLTDAEQRAAALIFVGPSAAPNAAADEKLAAAAAAHGARFERLFDGSAVALLSGALVATDLAAKAAHCALDLQRIAEGRRISLSLGWNESSGRLPLGRAIDRAAKLLEDETAQTSGDLVTLDESAVGLLEARFEVTKTGHSFVLQDERSFADVRTLLGKPTPFVGRDRDMRRIEELFEDCTGERRAMAAVVTAPAGMGKSRLGREIVHNLRAHKEAPSIWIARGQLLGAGSALGMLSELVQYACDIRGGESNDVRREKLVTRTTRLISAPHNMRVAAFLGEVIGARFPDENNVQLLAARRDSQLMGDMIREAFMDFVKAECEENPLMILLEDLHWGDGATIKIVDSVLREISEQPLFVLALARPEVHEAFPKLWQERNLQAIRLNQLSKRASEELARHVLGDRAGPEMIERIVRLADGNAFYLEELIRKASEGPEGDLPETVVAMVQSRLSGLDDVSRRLLRAASVFGEVFWIRGVAVLLGEESDSNLAAKRIHELSEAEFVTKRRDSRFVGQSEYAFRHALLREGAYAMLTEADRQLGHRLAAEWLQAHGETDALILAEHFEKGGEGEKAAMCYLRAADAACQGGDSETALRRVEQGLTAGPTTEVRVELLGIFCEAMAWALQNVELGLERAEDVLENAPPGSIPWGQAGFMKIVGCAFLGKFPELIATASRLLEAPILKEAVSTMQLAVCSAAYLLDIAGLLHLANPAVARAKEIAAAGDVMGSIALSRYLAVRSCYADENPWASIQHAAHAYTGGRARLDMTSRLMQGMGYLFLGVPERVKAIWSDVSLSDLDLGYVSSFRPFMQSWSDADQGNLESARRTAERLLEMGRTLGRALDESHGHWVLAEVLRRAGDLERADTEAQAALAMAIPLDKPGVLATLAALRLAQNRTDEALAAAEEGMKQYEEMHACSLFFRGGFLRAVHIECLLAAGNEELANVAIAKAHTWLLAIADEIGVDEFKVTFLNNVRENRYIMEFAKKLGLGTGSPT